MKRRYVLLLASIVFVLDQLTKRSIVNHFYPGQSIPIVPSLLSLTYVQNTGGAFGILPHGTLLLAAAAVLAVICVGVYTIRYQGTMPRVLAVGIGLPLGGAVGNLIDRMVRGFVVDFIDAHIQIHQWPVFNVADSAICIGVGCLVVLNWQGSARNSVPHNKTQEEHA